MRKKFIIGNWKMYGNKASVKELLTTLKFSMVNSSDKVSCIVCPPYIFLAEAQALLQDSQIALAAQNMAAEKEGAYTGEIAAAMLSEFGCKYVLLGHSERRTYYSETDALIAKKFQLATESGLVPILCIGETLEQYQSKQTQAVLQRQIEKILALGEAVLQKGILAYEPVWAIGTGISASPAQAQQTHQFLRQQVALHYPDLAQKLPILYGGSVKLDNAKALFEMPDIDGGLIGGASLRAHEFLQIYCDCVSITN